MTNKGLDIELLLLQIILENGISYDLPPVATFLLQYSVVLT